MSYLYYLLISYGEGLIVWFLVFNFAFAYVFRFYFPMSFLILVHKSSSKNGITKYNAINIALTFVPELFWFPDVIKNKCPCIHAKSSSLQQSSHAHGQTPSIWLLQQRGFRFKSNDSGFAPWRVPGTEQSMKIDDQKINRSIDDNWLIIVNLHWFIGQSMNNRW